MVDATFSKTIRGNIRLLNLAVFEICNTTQGKPEPQATLPGIGEKRGGSLVMSLLRPRNLLNFTLICRDTKKTGRFLGDPQVSRRVLYDGMDRSAREPTLQSNKLSTRQVTKSVICGDPDPSSSILKESDRMICAALAGRITAGDALECN